MAVELILGGARSGKSRHAQALAAADGWPVLYVATAWVGDPEMAARIAHHRRHRPAHWTVVEEPLRLLEVLTEHAGPGQVILVDCLTLWLSNLLQQPDGEAVGGACDRLVAALPGLPGRILLVSNEVGQGIIPLGELTRRFVDRAGLLHQELAALAERVVWMVAGLPVVVKPSN